MLLDLLAVNGALLLALALRPEHTLDWQLVARRPLWFLVLSLLWLLLAHAFDAYDLRVAGRLSAAAPVVLKSGSLTALIYLLIPYFTPTLPTRRALLGAFFLLILGFLVLARTLYALTLAQPLFRRRTLIVGAGWAGQTIVKVLGESEDRTFRMIGFVDDDPTKLCEEAREHGTRGAEGQRSPGAFTSGSQHPSASALPPVLGDRHALPDLIARDQISTLILAITHQVSGELLQILMDCLELGVEIIPMPVLYEELTGRVPIEHVGDNWYVALPIHHPLTRPLNRLIKRASDIVLALLGLVCLAPLFPFLALAIYLDSPGPIFYSQWRVGRGGRLFKAYKFRSMVPDAEQDEAVWAQENDPRVTRVGRILRRTHVDEFPQFLNILKGEMSAVGPRPERPEFVDELVQEIPFYRVRHAVKPGMAGWALVNYGYASSKEDALVKLQHDLYYIKHQSSWLDIVILLKTIVDTLTLRGR